MSYTTKITGVQKMRHQATNQDFLDVTFDIISGDDVVESRTIMLDPTLTSNDVRLEVLKISQAYEAEQAQKVEQSKQDKIDNNVTSLQEELVGSSVK